MFYQLPSPINQSKTFQFCVLSLLLFFSDLFFYVLLYQQQQDVRITFKRAVHVLDSGSGSDQSHFEVQSLQKPEG